MKNCCDSTGAVGAQLGASSGAAARKSVKPVALRTGYALDLIFRADDVPDSSHLYLRVLLLDK